MPPSAVNVDLNAVLFIIGALVCLYWLRALRLALEGSRLFVRNFLKAVVVFCVLMAALGEMRLQTHLQPSQEQLDAGFLSLVSFGQFQGRKRSRYISKSTKRAVIERDLKGEQYDSQKHHIDHVWPFSKGGSHTTDNLRVIEKKKNLQKGAKRPLMRDRW